MIIVPDTLNKLILVLMVATPICVLLLCIKYICMTIYNYCNTTIE